MDFYFFKNGIMVVIVKQCPTWQSFIMKDLTTTIGETQTLS